MSYARTFLFTGLVSLALACGGGGGGGGGTAPPPTGGGGGGGGTATSGGASSLVVVNNSSYDIYYLYMSSTADPNWGPDQLGSSVLSAGSSFTLNGVPCGNYDIKLVDEDRDECEIRNAYMCADTALTITNEQLLQCEGYH